MFDDCDCKTQNFWGPFVRETKQTKDKSISQLILFHVKLLLFLPCNNNNQILFNLFINLLLNELMNLFLRSSLLLFLQTKHLCYC